MKYLRRLLVISMIFSTSLLFASVETVLPGFNKVIKFDKVTAEYMSSAAKESMDRLDNELKLIYEIEADSRTFKNTVRAFDAAYDRFSSVYGVIYLMGNTHPTGDIRDAANAAIVELGKYDNALSLNEDLYKAFKEYSETDEAKELKGFKEKYLRETIKEFERNGFALSKEKRDELKIIQDRLSELSNTFRKNISEYDDYLMVDESDMAGLDEDYKKARLQENGQYVTPFHVMFGRTANVDAS